MKGLHSDKSNLAHYFKYYDYKVAELAYQADVFADLSRRIYQESGCDRKVVAVRIQKHRLAPIGFLALNSEQRGREILARQPIKVYCKYILDYKPERLGAVFYSTCDGEIDENGIAIILYKYGWKRTAPIHYLHSEKSIFVGLVIFISGGESMKRFKKLSVKLVGFVLLLATLLIVVALVAFGATSKSLANSLMEEQLRSACFLVDELLGRLNGGDYYLQDGQLYKGNVNLTARTEEIDRIGEMTGLAVTVLWGDVRKTTTIKNSSGRRVLDTALEADTARKVLAGEALFMKHIVIQGEQYTAYYMPLKQPGSEEIVGIIFTGKVRSAVDAYVDSNVLQALGLMTAVSVIFTLASCLTFLYRITGALTATSAYMIHLAEKDLSGTIEDKFLARGDEIGDIARSLSSVQESFRGVIHDLQVSAEGLDTENLEFTRKFNLISENIGNINIAVEEIARGSTEQAGETAKASSSIADIGVALNQNAEDVRGLNVSVESMSQYAEQVSDVLQKLLGIGGQTSQEVTVLKEETHNTNSSAQKINEAVNLIQDIAQQTNLLSLNASIEAARAGDSGKGFAVVAEAIRNLSEGSAKGAKQIAEIVGQLIHNSDVSVERMGTVEQNVMVQMEQFGLLEDVFRELNEEIQKVSSAAENISEQSGRITGMKDEINSVVEQLAVISEENAASTQETSASMQDLSCAIDECRVGTDKLMKLSEELAKKAGSFQL